MERARPTLNVVSGGLDPLCPPGRVRLSVSTHSHGLLDSDRTIESPEVARLGLVSEPSLGALQEKPGDRMAGRESISWKTLAVVFSRNSFITGVKGVARASSSQRVACGSLL